MAEMKNMVCPCCGGALVYDQTVQQVKCEFCNTEFNVSDLNAIDEDLNQEFAENENWNEAKLEEYEENEMKLFTCEACGGEIITDLNTSSTRCPYCNNPVFISSRLVGVYKPNYVIPFKLTKDDAVNNLTKYLKGKILLPNSFKKDNKIEDVSGLYTPYFIFDAEVSGRAVFRGTTTRTWRSGDYRYTKTNYYKLVRHGDIAFDNIPVDASKRMPDDLMESIEPFDFKEAKEFQVAYISGHCADKYDVSKEETFTRATTRIKEGTIAALRSTTTGYLGCTLTESSINMHNSNADYVYYPVWTLNTKYKDKNYKFAMNGQTGKLVGNLPMSIAKLLLFFFISFLLAGAITAAIAYTFTDEIDLRMPITASAGLIGGIIIGVVICLLLRKQLKPVRLQFGAKNYVRKNSFNLTYAKDIYLYSRTTRVRINTNNKR